MSSKERILYICHGNINRSAAAHIISKKLADKDAYRFRSAGVKAKAGGELTSKRMRETMAEHGYPTEGMRSTALTQELVDWADTIFYMDSGNLKRLNAFKLDGKKVKCLGEYAGLPRIKDPAFSGVEEFHVCVDNVEKALKCYFNKKKRAAVETASPVAPAVSGKASKEKAEKKEKKPFVPMEGHMHVVDFGRLLIETNDLDPIYVMLHKSGMDKAQLAAWCLAYSCYYHAGVASKCAEDPSKFWKNLKKGHDEKWPRGSERRHFRGHTSEYVTQWLPSEYKTPQDAVKFLIGPKDQRSFKNVSDRVQKWKYFGAWIAFKWADLIDRVMGFPVDFNDCSLGIYDGPRQGAELVMSVYGKHKSMDEVFASLGKRFSDLKAPPFYDRKINVQEVETVLCKWKSHCGGHYKPGKDSIEIYHGLKGWGDLAESLRKHVPKHFLKDEADHGKTKKRK